MATNRTEFLAAITRPLRECVVECDGCDFRLVEMTEKEGAEYELALQNKKGGTDFHRMRRELIARMLKDDQGNKIVEDVSELESMPRSMAGKLFEACLKLNNYESKELEQLSKN